MSINTSFLDMATYQPRQNSTKILPSMEHIIIPGVKVIEIATIICELCRIEIIEIVTVHTQYNAHDG